MDIKSKHFYSLDNYKTNQHKIPRRIGHDKYQLKTYNWKLSNTFLVFYLYVLWYTETIKWYITKYTGCPVNGT